MFSNTEAIIRCSIKMSETVSNRSVQDAKTACMRADIEETGCAEKKTRQNEVGTRENYLSHRSHSVLREVRTIDGGVGHRL